MNVRIAAFTLILAFAAAALLASHQNKHQALLIDEAQATTPELIRWHRSKEVRT